MPAPPPDAPSRRGSTARVLLFQRDEDAAYATAFSLGLAGWSTYPHSDADTLVEVCRAYQPQVVFLEADVRGETPTPAQDLRAACDDQDLVVVVLVDPLRAHDAEWASHRGYDAAVATPWRPSDLVALLRHVQGE